MTGMRRKWILAVGALAAVAVGVQAQTVYVATNGLSQSPYDTWQSAATNVHDAIDMANRTGRDVWINDGLFYTTNVLSITNVYTVRGANGPAATRIERNPAAGSFGMMEVLTSGVCIAGITMAGGNIPSGFGQLCAGVRMFSTDCVLTNCVIERCFHWMQTSAIAALGATVRDCVVTNCGGAGAAGQVVWLLVGCRVENCVFAGNRTDGGNSVVSFAGASNEMRRCRLTGNTGPVIAVVGGSVMENCLVAGNTLTGDDPYVVYCSGAIRNCTIAGNTLVEGAYGLSVYTNGAGVTNCIVYGNKAGSTAYDVSGGTNLVSYSCAPGLAAGWHGNVTADPLFVDAAAGDFRLRSASPCLDTGVTLADVRVDLDGQARPLDGGKGALYDMGAYEMNLAGGRFGIAFSGDVPLEGITQLDVVFRASPYGENRAVRWYGWDFNNDGVNEQSGGNLAVVTNRFGLGRHSIALCASNEAGEFAAATNVSYVALVGPELYVRADGRQEFPYETPAKAATNLADAADAAVAGCVVRVGTGTFAVAREVLIRKGFTVRGEGPAATTVARVAAAGKFRVFNLTAPAACLDGVTITNGMVTGPWQFGGGVKLAAGTVLTNCAIVGCRADAGASASALGATGATVADCRIAGNGNDSGGGIMNLTETVMRRTLIAGNGTNLSTMINIGGVGSEMRDCRITGNVRYDAYGYSQGNDLIYMGDDSRLVNCLVADNSIRGNGQIVNSYGGALINTTVAGNRTTNVTAGSQGCGVFLYYAGWSRSPVTNSIVAMNACNGAPRDLGGTLSYVGYSCAPSLAAGAGGNLTNPPAFRSAAAGDYSLAPGSPCIDAGLDMPWMETALDVSGRKRLRFDGVDMGAYEFQPPLGMVIQVR